jgi:integrase
VQDTHEHEESRVYVWSQHQKNRTQDLLDRILPGRKGETTASATVHMEVTMLKALLNISVRHGKLDHNPIQRVKMVPVNNVRERVLTQAEFELLFEDFTFHDLRHCAINNLRQAGNDYFKIMAISGHKTMSVFKRYNLVTEEELVQVKWADQMNTEGTMDTYMDTTHKDITSDKT